MRTKTFFTTGLLAGLLAGLCGCYFTSENPLPKSAGIDRELLGWWRMVPEKAEDRPGHILFLEDRDGGLQVVVTEDAYRYDETYRGFGSELSGEKYLNLRQVSLGAEGDPPTLQKEYYLVHYRVVGRTRLELSLLNEALFQQAQKDGRLKGRLPAKGEDLVLTAPTEALAAFVRSQAPANLRGDKLVPAEKVERLPEVPPAGR